MRSVGLVLESSDFDANGVVFEISDGD